MTAAIPTPRLDAYDQCECGRQRNEHGQSRAAWLDGCDEFRLQYRYLANVPPPSSVDAAAIRALADFIQAHQDDPAKHAQVSVAKVLLYEIRKAAGR